MKYPFMLSTALTLSSVPVYANDVSFGFTDDSVSARYQTAVKEKVAVGAGLIHNNDEDRTLADIGVFVTSDPAELQGQVGVKAFYTDLDHGEDGAGLTFGGNGELKLTDIFSLYGGLFYAPSATVSGDLDGYREINLGVQATIFENARLGLGYTDTYVKTETRSDAELEDGMKLFLTMKF